MKKALFLSIILGLLFTAANAEVPRVGACPTVIHTNDGSIDVYTQEYAMALASAGEINLVGIIADEGTGYISTKKAYVKPKVWEKGRQQCADIVGKARRSGMINIPDPVAGASWALDRPASGIIEDTAPLDTPGSRLIVQQANKATPEKPVYIVTGGALTSVADAYLLDNSITDKVVVVSIFGFTSHMGGYNGHIDGWATYIVLQKFKYIQFCVNELSYYPDVPKARLAGKGMPENELKRLMLDKEQQHVHIPVGRDMDVPPIIYLMRPDYVLTTKKVSFSHWKNTKAVYGNSYPKVPVFKDDPAGNAIVVTSADKKIATAEWWRAMSNPAAYTGTVIQQSPFNAVPFAVPGKIQAEEFDWGGKGVAFNELSIANSPKYTYTTGWPLYRVDASIADINDDYEGNIEECQDAGSGYNLMGLAPGEWLEYTINVTEAKSYDIILRVASSGTGRVRIKLDGVDKTGVIDIPDTGGAEKWQDVVIKSVPLDRGKQVMQIYVEQGGFKFNYFVIGFDDDAFIKIREVTLGDPHPVYELWVPHFTDTIYQKYPLANWDIARLRTYVDMLKAFGFNSIQLYDLWQRYFDAGWNIPPEEWSGWPEERPKKADPRDWPEKMDAVADYARSIGLRTTLFVWGNAAFDYRNNAIPVTIVERETQEMDYLEPDDPADMELVEQYWDHQANHASHFDHIVTHWVDPGGCRGPSCTIETAMRFHNEIVRRFRKKNPNIQSTFSLWGLHRGYCMRWRGYKGVRTVLDSGILPADVMIAMDGRSGRIKWDDAKAVSKAGRKVGVWGWYLTDNEIYPSMHVRTNVLGSAFGKLPPDAHNLIEWYSIDSNSHGLNMQNLYVAGKLMRNPKADARAALREFIAGAFGVENVARVEKVFRAIESTRGLRGYRNTSANLPIAREAHKLALGITIPKGFEPAFPMVISPKDLAGEVVAQTEALVELYEFGIAADKVKQMQKEGAGQDKIKAAIANLSKVSVPTEWLTNLEYASYLKKLKELK